ncbi:hypothetical protein SAVERM_5559 [Streptomyces avermitilis MA-4680 = NBRC 14893]|uniref:Uncharacterized protein n=1 Tax=Streptomyces avermitilis (strain ATCC 31267 / DSM 46492 / JCM 5070 / NBRC 14893 / NCIMB 12804 / NRRL 8165 / MA-4680) TaxID=227882 RepID=Q82BZ5_STRAW|nr:hypothetical protein SAVERM_5559 [Streptomyces avermitilis MA-4680 = NBRC 14893]
MRERAGRMCVSEPAAVVTAARDSPPPPLPVPSRPWELPPPDPRFGLHGLVLKRRTG